MYFNYKNPFNEIQKNSYLKENLDASKNIDTAISNYKPNIFWKDKPVVKIQMNKWNLENIKKLIIRINDIELLIKKFKYI